MWRTLHGAIPCKSILANKHMKIHTACPVCQVYTEDIRHALFECARAQMVWENLGLLEKVERTLNVDRAGSAVLEELICTSIDDPLYLAQTPVSCLIALSSWFLWWERGQYAKGEKISEPERSAL